MQKHNKEDSILNAEEKLLYAFMQKRYLTALLIIVVVATISGFVMHGSTKQQLAFKEIISLSNRQLMLSQRIALLSSELILADNTRERESTRKELTDTTELMHRSHLSLTQSSEDKNIPAQYSHIIHQMYFDSPQYIDKQITEYLKTARIFNSIPDEKLTKDHPTFFDLLNASTSVLTSLNNIVIQLGREDHTQNTQLQNTIFLLLALLYCTIICTIYTIFRPMIYNMIIRSRELQDAGRAKSEFLTSMSHEIRTPLTGIMGNTELLLHSELTYKQQQHAKTVLYSAESLLELINDILDFSKIESGKMELESYAFSLEALARDAAQLLSIRAREKEIELIMHYVPGTPEFVIGDAARIRQVMFNLIGNAIKFTYSGHVLMTISKTEPSNNNHKNKTWIKIAVTDTGMGIPEDKQKQIFEKFTQGDGSMTRQFGGTGLGLAICTNIANLMGGDMGVESAVDEGSTFWIKVPLERDNNVDDDSTDASILSGIRTLIVDDIEANRDIIKEQLTSVGMECTTCESGKDALHLLFDKDHDDTPFQLAILDYQMPEMDGEQLARQIKSSQQFAKLPLIMLTSLDERGYIHRFANAGFSAILSKPVRNDVLYKTIANVWKSHQLGKNTGLISIEGNMITQQVDQALQAEMEDNSPIFKGFTVLLVEDNHINSILAQEMLAEMGLETVSAENGLTAVEIMQDDNIIDLILMDCMMPEMDGFEATMKLRLLEEQKAQHIPIIALTANAMTGDKEKCLKAGMDDYLAKPVRKRELRKMLKKWLFDTNHTTQNTSSVSQRSISIIADSMLEREAVEHAKTIMGNRFPTMVTFFIDDTEQYIRKIKNAMTNNQLKEISNIAHTIKASARSLGAKAVSDIAKEIEFVTRDIMNGKEKNISSLSPLLFQLENFFQETKEAFNELLQKPH